MACTRCKILKPVDLEHFPPDRAKKSGFGSWCRICKREHQRTYNTSVRPRPKIEQRTCQRDSCLGVFEWTSEHADQAYCSRDCWEWDNRRAPAVQVHRIAYERALAKTCGGCHRFLPISKFHRNKHKPLGTQYACKDCQRLNFIMRTYGRTREQALEAMQPGPCAICGVQLTTRDVDHCHKDGHFRGLLCNRHNRALGLLRDNVDEILALATYLERS